MIKLFLVRLLKIQDNPLKFLANIFLFVLFTIVLFFSFLLKENSSLLSFDTYLTEETSSVQLLEEESPWLQFFFFPLETDKQARNVRIIIYLVLCYIRNLLEDIHQNFLFLSRYPYISSSFFLLLTFIYSSL